MYPTTPPFAPQAAPPRRTSGLAVTALVLGLVGLVVSWFTFAVPSILAMIFGGVALWQTSKDGLGGRGMAIAGFALGTVVTIATWLVWGVIWGSFGDAVDEAAEQTTRPAATAPSLGGGDPDVYETTTPTYTPTAADFKITLKVKSKDCFGSAGCNVVYEPQLTIVGGEVDQNGTYEITYEVRGGQDGSSIDTLDVSGGQYSASENLVQTAGQAVKLTAVITEVSVR